MANTILLKKSTIAAKVPTTSDLQAGEICLNFADAKIYGRHPGNNTIVTFTSGGGGGAATINDLDEMFTSARATYYHEVNYTAGGDVSAIEVYASSAKTTHLYSRSFTYDASGNLTQILTTDQQNAGVSLTKTITYTGSGDIATVTRNYNI
jgi:hypothetical protein